MTLARVAGDGIFTIPIILTVDFGKASNPGVKQRLIDDNALAHGIPLLEKLCLLLEAFLVLIQHLTRFIGVRTMLNNGGIEKGLHILGIHRAVKPFLADDRSSRIERIENFIEGVVRHCDPLGTVGGCNGDGRGKFIFTHEEIVVQFLPAQSSHVSPKDHEMRPVEFAVKRIHHADMVRSSDVLRGSHHGRRHQGDKGIAQEPLAPKVEITHLPFRPVLSFRPMLEG